MSARRYFGTDGIRGRVGEGAISADFVLRLGNAYGRALTAAARDGERERAELGGEVAGGAVQFPVIREEVVREQRDVLGALPQRGQLDRDHAQPVVQVLAQHPLPNRLLRVTVGR